MTLSVNNPLHASTHEQRHVQNVSVKHVFVTFKRHQLRSQNFASTSTLEDIKREAYSRPTGSRARRCHTQPMSKFQKHQRGIRNRPLGVERCPNSQAFRYTAQRTTERHCTQGISLNPQRVTPSPSTTKVSLNTPPRVCWPC